MTIRNSASTPELIDDAKGFSALCERVSNSGWFAFDTEFVGEDQFRPEVCLIQVADDHGIQLIDSLAGFSVDEMWEMVADPAILKIVHAGPEDVAQTWYTIDKRPANVFDIQIAAGFLGQGYPISLSRLARMMLGMKLHKSQTLSDWRRRPLHADQIGYAAEDVAHLRPLYDKIVPKLKKLNRLDWLRFECDAMCDGTKPVEDRTQRLRKLKGAGSLSPRELAIAYAILDEREKLATEYNRPVRAVIRDHIVVELARRGWTDIDRLRSIRGLSLAKPAIVRIVEIIEAAKALPKDQWPELPNKEDAPQEDVLIDLLGAILKNWCLENDMSYGLLCKKQWLRDLVRTRTRDDSTDTDIPLMQGWRKACVGNLISRIITGHASVKVDTVDKLPKIVIEENTD